MPPNDKAERLTEFIAWVAKHIKGDEKGEAQVYLDRLFKGFGWNGWKEAGAGCEERIKNDTGGTSFADLVWKPHVVIEMKKRGVDLAKHYSQAFTYWTRLVPNRPRYAVLCNFDEFWIYDFDVQLDTPVDKVKLADLPHKYGPLNFLFPGDVEPVFGNHNEEVTRAAADKLAACFNSMIKRDTPRELAQRFTLQMLMSLFAEDIGLLDKYFVTKLVEECKSPEDTFDKLGGLFAAMNNATGNTGGRYKGVSYFNGGLFAEPAHVELNAAERTLLKEACLFDWSKVRPEIFGTIFEHSLGTEERAATGAHYTSPVDIMKIIGPTIVEPWTSAIDGAKTLTELQGLANRLQTFTVLDPACGSGNFLFTAYRELKRIEAALYARMAERFPKSVDPLQRPLGFVTATNFFGMDINPFAVEIAKVTMMLAHKLSIDELHVSESALPLDNLGENFRAGDALIMADNSAPPWFKTDVIIGNPPFLGAKLLKPKLGASYMKRVRNLYPDIPGMADLCVYWIRRAHDELPQCTQDDPLAGRAGLVGTQNIRNNASRRGGLDHVVVDGTIVEAVDNQPWSGEANVNVSIANWIKTQDPRLVPKKRRFWYEVSLPVGTKKRKKGIGPKTKQYQLDMREVDSINSALSDKIDVSQAATLTCNTVPQKVFQGLTPGHKGFELTPKQRDVMVAAEPSANTVVHSFIGGDQVLTGVQLPHRYVIDFEQRSITDAAKYPLPFARVQSTVLPEREKAAIRDQDEEGRGRSHHEGFLNRWWQLSWGRADLLAGIAGLPRYMACSRVTKRPIFVFVSGDIRPGDSLQVFAFADDYSFGVLQAMPHQEWFLAKSSKLTKRLRYTPESVYETFPWPQAPTATQIEAVARAARHLREVRADATSGTKGGLRALYRLLDVPGKNPLKDAHAALDAAVLDAYGFSAKKDVLQQLFALNQAVASSIATGKNVTAPGIPAPFGKAASLVSKDALGT